MGAQSDVSRDAGEDQRAGECGGEEVWELDWREHSGEFGDVSSDVDFTEGV